MEERSRKEMQKRLEYSTIENSRNNKELQMSQKCATIEAPQHSSIGKMSEDDKGNVTRIHGVFHAGPSKPGAQAVGSGAYQSQNSKETQKKLGYSTIEESRRMNFGMTREEDEGNATKISGAFHVGPSQPGAIAVGPPGIYQLQHSKETKKRLEYAKTEESRSSKETEKRTKKVENNAKSFYTSNVGSSQPGAMAVGPGASQTQNNKETQKRLGYASIEESSTRKERLEYGGNNTNISSTLHVRPSKPGARAMDPSTYQSKSNKETQKRLEYSTIEESRRRNIEMAIEGKEDTTQVSGAFPVTPSQPTPSNASLGAYQSRRDSKIDNIYPLEDTEITCREFKEKKISIMNAENEYKTKFRHKKWIIISLIIFLFITLAISLGVGLSRKDKSSVNQPEIISCDFADITEIDHLPIAWRSCLCNNNRKADIPASHVSKYKSLKERFIQKSILPDDFDDQIEVCDSRSIALLWLAEDMIENEKVRNDDSLTKRFALALLYLSTINNNNPSQWSNNAGWMTFDTECNWAGISCDESDNNGVDIKSIDLQKNNLYGSIPPEISLLAEGITSLRLFGNNISGSIPSEIGFLSKLTFLHLSQNTITGAIPTEIGLLSDLGTLLLEENFISGIIPTEIGLQTNSLKTLDLSKNRLQDTIPTEICQLAFLKNLLLDSNQLKGTIPSEIGNLESLLNLRLGNNQITGSIPSSIGLCSRLGNIYLEGNKLVGIIPKEIGQLQMIQELNFERNKLTKIPSTIGLCKDLKGINLTSNNFGGTIPTEFGSLSKLDTLRLRSNNLTGTIPTELSNCQDLRILDLEQNRGLEGTMPTEVGKLLNLELLSICRTELTGIIPDQICSLKKAKVKIDWGDSRKCSCCEDRCYN